MAELLIRNWWAVAGRAGAALLLALAVPLLPGLTLDQLVAAFAAYAFADGVLAVIGALKPAGRDRRAAPRREALLFEAVCGLGFGLLVALWPVPTLAEFEGLTAAWALATGGCKLWVAWRLRARLAAGWLFGAAGAASLGFGVRLALTPVVGAASVVAWVAGVALALSASLGALAFALWARRRTRVPQAEPARA
jgi:uncharacterized membrane protein HdeD (DUF308 family)